MTKDIMRAAIAKDITEAKENNIKFINKMDQNDCCYTSNKI